MSIRCNRAPFFFEEFRRLMAAFNELGVSAAEAVYNGMRYLLKNAVSAGEQNVRGQFASVPSYSACFAWALSDLSHQSWRSSMLSESCSRSHMWRSLLTTSLRWSTVALTLVMVAAVSTPTFADAATGRQGDDSGVPADLFTLDYEPYVFTLDDVRSVSGLAPGEPYTSREPTGFLAGENIPALCGEVAGGYRAGAVVTISGADASDIAVQNRIGGVTNAKKTLADLKSLAKGCDAPYTDGRFAPAARQPKVKKAGDGVVAFVSTSSAPPAASISQLFVRNGKYFVSSLLVGSPGTGGLGRTDLDRLAKRMADHLVDLEREFRRS